MTQAQDTESYIVIIGAMKSGTTTLFSMLAEHPQIAPATPKEPGFFAFEDIHARGFEWYHGLFDFDPARHRYRLDGSTDYTKAPFVTGVWERMTARKGARYKLVYIMRHPLRRIESHARHVQWTRKELGQILSTKADHGLDHGVSLPSLAMTQYARQLAPFREVWAAGDLFVMTLEELKARPETVMPALWAFLDLDPLPEKAAAHENAGAQKTRVVDGWAALGRMGWLMSLGRTLLPQGARETIKGWFRRDVKLSGRFRLSSEEEQALWHLLEPDMRVLEDDYRVEVSQLWARPAKTR